VHARWLNQIEIYFSMVLQRKVLTPNDFPARERSSKRLMELERYYESIAGRVEVYACASRRSPEHDASALPADSAPSVFGLDHACNETAYSAFFAISSAACKYIGIALLCINTNDTLPLPRFETTKAGLRSEIPASTTHDLMMAGRERSRR
jgi:hypothetical protein